MISLKIEIEVEYDGNFGLEYVVRAENMPAFQGAIGRGKTLDAAVRDLLDQR